MPALGADMTSGVVSRWLVKPGDEVRKGGIVAEIETDKAVLEAESFESGVVERILVPEGERVPVGTPLALLRGAREAVALPPLAVAPVPLPVAAAVAPPEPVPVAAVAGNGERARAARVEASPLARRMAALLHVDLAGVHGTGPGGAVTRADVQAAAPAQVGAALPAPPEAAPATAAAPAVPAPPPTTGPAPAAEGAAERLAAMQRAVGELMARSKREVPHYYVGHHIDMTAALAHLEQLNLERAVADRILPAAVLLRATALAARRAPEINGFWTDGAFHPAQGVHLGVAIALRGGGLVAPCIHDCDEKSLDEIMRDLRDLVARARVGRMRTSEMSDPTITVTNLGDQGTESVYGVIYAPQVALVGFGRIAERPWAENGMLGVRKVVHATLSADHRASDGHRGARFLSALDNLLQEPGKL